MPMRVVFDRLPTEQRNLRSRHLDQLPLPALLHLMNREDAQVPRAVAQAIPQIAQAIRLITHALRSGGRLFFIGAGTSGRLGVLEAAECPPTFHTAPSLVQAIIAGGRSAVFRSKEGAEDRRKNAAAVVKRAVRPGDVVVGIAASGVTLFVGEGVRTARRLGARTVFITCNPRASVPADIRVALATGPEVLTGSTRLKAGTATKLVLNMLTLGAMVQLGKTYGNLMVDVRPTSRKLRARAVRIVRSLTPCSQSAAEEALRAARGSVKVAALMRQKRLTYAGARERLRRTRGSLRKALIR